MNKFICKILKQDPESREGIITSTSVLSIVVNIIIAFVKVLIGLISSSIAIVSEGINNVADALTSVLTLAGTKLAEKHPDEKHPFGYGRIEYLTGLVVAVLILVTGCEMLISSVKIMFHPAELGISYISLIIVAASAIIKFIHGIYTMKMGRKAGSSALEAVGIESRNDSFASIITIVSSLVFLIFKFSIDAYAGAITSLIIIKAGLDVLIETISELLGRPGEKELADKLYSEIRGTDGIVNAADMMLHNYGPDNYSGSVNIEIDHSKSIGEVYQFIHKLQLRIMHEYKVTMVFGVYAVDNDHKSIKELRRYIGSFVQSHEHVKSFHALYLDSETRTLYCDLIVDYSLRDWDELKDAFNVYIKDRYDNVNIELTVETEYV